MRAQTALKKCPGGGGGATIPILIFTDHPGFGVIMLTLTTHHPTHILVCATRAGLQRLVCVDKSTCAMKHTLMLDTQRKSDCSWLASLLAA
jgi:hypothetical protein